MAGRVRGGYSLAAIVCGLIIYVAAGGGAAMSAAPLRVMIDRTIIAAADAGAVRAAIAKANATARTPGLPDSSNPAIIDPVKAEALLAALMKPSGNGLAPLKGRALDLDPMPLRIGTSSPTAAESFAHPFVLKVTSEHGHTVSATASVPVDCQLARDGAAEARRQTELADREVRTAAGGSVMALKLRRYAAAMAWLDNAAAHLACAPHDGAAIADRDAADRMMRSSAVLGGRME